MNITTDNYEAYLLDYLEGNLSPDETQQLEQFVAALGLNWDELTEPLPSLEAPQTVYAGKENLKKKRAIVPLYVKIASAAAAAGLLLTVTLWPGKQLPKIEPIAELKPILPGRLITADEVTTVTPSKTAYFIQPTQTVTKEKPVVSERIDMSLLAELEPKKAQALPTLQHYENPDVELLAYQMNANLAFNQYMESDSYDLLDLEEYEDHRSLLARGLLWLTKGRHDSFASLIGSGVRKAKQGITEAATDMALTAYSRVEEQLEETRERWEEKQGE